MGSPCGAADWEAHSQQVVAGGRRAKIETPGPGPWAATIVRRGTD
ncbi:MAG: hypothetical protein AAF961_04920 [Planctomycetota bacterium]